MKKRTLLLNVSLILGTLYHALFLAGYLLQKPIFGHSQLQNEVYERLEPVYFTPVIVVTAVSGVGFAAFALFLRKNASKSAFIGAEFFSGCAFVGQRLVNFFAPSDPIVMNKIAAEKGELGLTAYTLSNMAIMELDAILLVLFAAAITLMCCASCVKE